jgi:putative membrane protein
LFVYHASSEDSISIDRFKVMERKLFWGIATPGGIITIALGFWLIEMSGFSYSMLWLQAKLAAVGVLVLYHIWCGKLVLDFKRDKNRHSHVWYRLFNEFPVLILIAVVLLVEFKPV